MVLIISGKDASDEESSQYPPVGIAHLLDEIGGLVRQQFECLRNAVTFEYGTISVTIGEPAFNLLLIDIGPAGMIKVVAQCSYHKSKCMMLVKGRQKSGISSESVGSVHDSHSMMIVVEGVAVCLILLANLRNKLPQLRILKFYLGKSRGEDLMSNVAGCLCREV